MELEDVAEPFALLSADGFLEPLGFPLGQPALGLGGAGAFEVGAGLEVAVVVAIVELFSMIGAEFGPRDDKAGSPLKLAPD